MSTEDAVVRTVLIVVAVILLLPLLMMLFMLPMLGVFGWGHMWNGGTPNGMGGWWLLLVLWLLTLAVLLGGGYALYRSSAGRPDREGDPALEELRLAYARGDLSDEEFDERRARLERDR
ncbi:SHOCT domain-containing protein [Natrononativus amylolyticus]|uniref:SHOCT domain-containing protein n=1 Tax=Natrononativus amylolyticus TaxID=2963434 RepID=UPI0020CEA490|nr:SHOCT domain-containing protein [Natrononativus amylolyticus]